MRKIVPGLTLSVLIVAGLNACRPTGDTAAHREIRPRIALVMQSLANEFFRTMAEGAAAHHAQHADAFDLTVEGISNQTDIAGQIVLVERFIERHVDAIVITPSDSRKLVPVLRRAIEAGIVVVTIDNRLDPETLQAAGIKIPFVGPDNRAGAAAVAQVAADRLARGDEVAILEGIPTAYDSRQRRLGFQDAIQRAGLKLGAIESGDWEIQGAQIKTRALLQSHPDLRAIFCANDRMALGAVAALAAAGPSRHVLITGFDATHAIKPLLQSGAVAATADQHADLLATFGIDAALELLQTKGVADRATPVDVITDERSAQPDFH